MKILRDARITAMGLLALAFLMAWAKSAHAQTYPGDVTFPPTFTCYDNPGASLDCTTPTSMTHNARLWVQLNYNNRANQQSVDLCDIAMLDHMKTLHVTLRVRKSCNDACQNWDEKLWSVRMVLTGCEIDNNETYNRRLLITHATVIPPIWPATTFAKHECQLLTCPPPGTACGGGFPFP